MSWSSMVQSTGQRSTDGFLRIALGRSALARFAEGLEFT